MSRYAIGIDLGGTRIKGALVERSEGIQSVQHVDTEAAEGPSHVIDQMASLIRDLGAEATDQHVAGVGIGAPGAIDLSRAKIASPPNLPGWDVIDVRQAIKDRLGAELTVFVENDANVAGLGSAFFGAGRPYDHFIMVTLGTGVGGAIIHHKKIFRGATGAAGEIGHMTIDYEGPFARSGVAGAIEAYLGQRFFSQHARDRLLTRPETRIHEMAGDELADLTPKMLYEAAMEGDENAREMFAWAGHKLGCVLGSAVNLLDIRTIIVGGGISAAGDLIFDTARRTITGFITPGLRDGVQIIQETLGNEAGMLGAAYLVFEYLDARDTPSSPGA